MKIFYSILVIVIVVGVSLISCNKSSTTPKAPSSISVSSIKPTSGSSDIIDTITGVGFSATASEDSVLFNGTSAGVIHATATQLIVKVPVEAGTGPVKVIVQSQSATGPVFTFTGDSTYIVSTLAGNGNNAVVNGTGSGASFSSPTSVVVDTAGNLFVLEYNNLGVRKVSPTGVVTNFVGGGASGSANGTGAAASFAQPNDIAIDGSGNLYVADWGNDEIRKITPAGVVSTFAGALNAAYVDATGSAARFFHPASITADPSGNLFVFDAGNNRIRKITSAGVVTTFIGTGTANNKDGTGTAAGIGSINGLCSDASGNLYLADLLFNNIRKVTSAAVTSTFAGSGNASFADGTGTNASIWAPTDAATDKYGNIYVADQGNALIRKISPAGVVTTIAGIAGTEGAVDGPGKIATFSSPWSVAVDKQGNIYVADFSNEKIRKLTPQ